MKCSTPVSSAGAYTGCEQQFALLGLSEQLGSGPRAGQPGDRGLGLLELAGRAVGIGEQPHPEVDPVECCELVAAAALLAHPLHQPGGEAPDGVAEQQRDRDVAVGCRVHELQVEVEQQDAARGPAGPTGTDWAHARGRGRPSASSPAARRCRRAGRSRCGRAGAVASAVPTAACEPACSQLCGAVMRSGARSESPVMAALHAEAAMVRSEAAQPALGPVPPKGVTVVCTSPGLSARSSSWSRPRPGSGDSINASAPGNQFQQLVPIADDAALRATPKVPPAQRRAVGTRLPIAAAPTLGAFNEDHLRAQRAEDRRTHRSPVIGEVQNSVRLSASLRR